MAPLAEVAQQFLPCCLLGEHPVVELEGEVLCAEVALEVWLVAPLVQHLLWREVAQQLLHIVGGALSREEFACRYVEESHSAGGPAEVHGGQEVVFLVVKHVVGHGHPGRHQFGDAPLHELLCELRVFQLVAYCHALAGPYQLGQVGVEGVVRKSGHLCLRPSPCPVAPPGERYAEYARCRHGVFAVGLVEVAAAEEQHCVGMLRLEVEELFHHRRELVVFLSHCRYVFFFS